MKELIVRFEDLDHNHPLMDAESFFVKVLSDKYRVKVLYEGDEEPDVLIYSWLGANNTKWRNSIRIYYTMEMDYPDFNICDYAIGLANIGLPERFMHFPHYVFYDNLLQKYEKKTNRLEPENALNRGFCSTVVSNLHRNKIYHEMYSMLNEYKPVASGGKFNNNVGGAVTNKVEFIKNYKFNLAFENMNVDGYVTEKIMEAFVAQTIPIYWGSKQVKKEFGEGGYIDISDFSTLDNAINYIKKVDTDDELYMQILSHRAELQYSYDEWFRLLSDFLYNAIEYGKRTEPIMMNARIWGEKYVFYRLRESIPGRLYRWYKRHFF